MLTRALLASTLAIGHSIAMANDSLPYKTAAENGIKTCLTQIRDVGNFIVKGNAHASHDFWNRDNANDRMFSSFLVKSYSDGDSHISVIVGPDKSGACYAEYNETSFWPKSCTVLREEVFSGVKFSGALKGTTTVLENPEGSVNIYMPPQNGGNSCLTTKREVIYY